MLNKLLVTTAISLVLFSQPACADDISDLKHEIQEIKANYQTKITTLESRIKNLEAKKDATAEANIAAINQIREASSSPDYIPQLIAQPVAGGAPSNPNAFNPAIGVVMNGLYGTYSQKTNNVSGFAVGDDGQRGDKGLNLGESEVSFNANIDDWFSGNLVTSVSRENEISVEEGFVQTLGLPDGLNVKAGRMLASIGYMNEKHEHTDDFSDRPLPYRAFLNGAFNDDGIQASIVLPTDFYSELGAGIWRGDDFPGSDAQGSRGGSYTAYARIGDDIGDNQNWRLGASYLHSRADGAGRITGDTGSEQTFKGNDDIYIADAKYSWAPTGNAVDEELSLQGEYFWRKEDGTYADLSIAAPDTPFNDSQSGWYGQAVYKFLPEWRVGYRYTELSPSDVPAALAGGALDSQGHDPYINSAMVDYTHSEFSRIRFQYNNDHAGPETDNQFLVQYIMSMGAHGAHKY